MSSGTTRSKPSSSTPATATRARTPRSTISSPNTGSDPSWRPTPTATSTTRWASPTSKKRYGIPFAMSLKDAFLLDNASTSGSIFGVPVGEMPSVDTDLDTTPEIRFGHTVLRVLRTPGHTPGHVALYEPQSKSLFTGDTLFRESIGRTDLPGGDYSWIMRSILDILLPLGDEVHVYPGHGPESTIGHEVLYNPFIVEVLNEEVNYKD